MIDVVVLEPSDTHDLRRSVLRAGDANASVDWPGDHDTSTLHLGVTDDGRIVAVSTWLDRPCADHPSVPARQLRGMATDPAHRGIGLGARLLDHGVRRAVAEGADLVWANARVEAIGFYELHGWRVAGPVFVTTETGLPHQLVTRSASG